MALQQQASVPNTHLPFKRWKLALYRVAHDEALLDDAYKGVLGQIRKIEDKHRDSAYKKGWNPNRHFLAKLNAHRAGITRTYKMLHKQCLGIISTRNRLFNGCSAAEMGDRLDAILRIPQEELRHFEKLSEEEQESRLLVLIEQYGNGSGNGGFSAALLNMPGYYSSHLLNKDKEPDGSNRRPQFIHEMIDRIIYAALHPAQHKQLFFSRTTNVVKRWNYTWRQIRSEGRLSIVKVLVVLLPYIDFRKSLRAGFPVHGTSDYTGIPIKHIANTAHMSMDSVKQALRNLVDLQLLHPGKQPIEEYQNKEGMVCYAGLPVIRCFTPNIIARLGLGKRWEIERKVVNKAALSPEQRAVLEELEAVNADPESFSAREKAFAEIHFVLTNPAI